jgi:hypothetical protein
MDQWINDWKGLEPINQSTWINGSMNGKDWNQSIVVAAGA